MLCIDKAMATNKSLGSENSDGFALGAALSFGLKRKQAAIMTKNARTLNKLMIS
jgi:hypothetical protein